MYENDWWTERLPLLRPSAGFKPRKFPLHREKAWKVKKYHSVRHSESEPQTGFPIDIN